MSATAAVGAPADLPASLEAEIDAVETWRRATLRRLLLVCGGLAALGIALTLALALAGMADPGVPIVLIVSLVAVLVAWGWITSGFRREFKRRLVTPVVQAFLPGLGFEPDAYIERAEFEHVGLFRGLPITHYRGEDLVRGQVGATAIRFSELHAENVRTTRDAKGRTSTQRTTIFQGLFFCADFNKHFAGRTYVLPDTAERLFGALGRSLQSLGSSHGELVALEDPEFERQFVVYASNQIEARYILSSALMARLLDFRRAHGRPFHLAFVDSHLYLALNLGRNLFEPSLFASLADRRWLDEIWRDLAFLTGLVETLNLNTRIWSKA